MGKVYSMSLISPDRLNVIRFLCDLVKDIPGNAIEVGVYKGGSLAVIAKAIPHKTVFGFDTFTGLPQEKRGEGEVHQAGDFSDTSLETVEASLRQCEVPNVRLVQGIFPESAPTDIGRISFAHLDVDFGQSSKEAIEWVAERLSPGGIIVSDDYGWHHCPNVKPVIDAFIASDIGTPLMPGWPEIGLTQKKWEFYNPVPKQCWLRKRI